MQPTGWPWAARQKDSSCAITGCDRAASHWGGLAASEPNAPPERDGMQALAATPYGPQVLAGIPYVPQELHATRLRAVTQLRAAIENEPQVQRASPDAMPGPACSLDALPALDGCLQPPRERVRPTAAPRLPLPDVRGWR